MPTEAENIWDNGALLSPESAKVIDLAKAGTGQENDPALRPSGLECLKIVGGHRLSGTICVSGAKNAALKLMCAALLTGDSVTLEGMPLGLGDMRTLAALLRHIGASVLQREDGLMIVHARDIANPVAPYDLVRRMRGSVLVLGPLLARHGFAEVSLPGGCAIGTRPVDFHIAGLRAMGAEIAVESGYIRATAPQGRLRGGHYVFPRVSHTGTENLMMAATLAHGTTILENCACEPEVSDLATCLRAMGADIRGDGTRVIVIEGRESLHGATHRVLPDRIEAGTWMIAVGMAGGDITLENARLDHLGAVVPLLTSAGMEIRQDGNNVHIHRNGLRLRGIDILTEPYPGFPTDLQAQMMAMLTTCEGAGMVTETIFENRFMHVPELCRMGANITVHDSSAIVRGVPRLKGAEVMATDLRASVALVLAGLVAEGETTVNRIYHLDRGYENIVSKLHGVGAEIARR